MFAKLFDRCVDLIAARVAGLLPIDEVCNKIAVHINITKVSEIVCDRLDIEEIAKRAADSVSTSDVASHMDAEDIAQHVEVDYYDLAGRMEASEVAAHLDLTDIAREIEIDTDDVTVDYTALAKALIRELGAGRAVEVKASK